MLRYWQMMVFDYLLVNGGYWNELNLMLCFPRACGTRYILKDMGGQKSSIKWVNAFSSL
jgi:hypothetical protein